MICKSSLRPSEQFKKLKTDFYASLSTADRSHLEPPALYTLIEYVYSGDRDQRFQSPYRETPHYWYWRPVQRDRTLDDIRERCRIRALERHFALANAGIQVAFDSQLDAFIWQPASFSFRLGHHLSQRNSILLTRSDFFATGRGAAGSEKIRSGSKNRQSLPDILTQNEKNLAFLAQAQECSKVEKSLGFCNTQTNGGHPPKITINRSDFLAR
jgi:hypothetical protein